MKPHTRTIRQTDGPSVTGGRAARSPRRFHSMIAGLMFLPLANQAQDPPHPTTEGNTFYSESVGLRVTKPEAWTFASTDKMGKKFSEGRLNDRELLVLLRAKPNQPLVQINQYPEPYVGVNPSVLIMMQPLGTLAEKPPRELMMTLAQTLEKTYEDFAILEQARDTEFHSHQAAEMLIRFSEETRQGVTRKKQSRMWLVPRGRLMFLIAMSGHQDGAMLPTDAFETIFRSIRIDK